MPLTAKALLNVPVDEPERLVVGGPDTALAEFRSLLAEWHPDRCGDPLCEDVFVHVSALYREVQSRLKEGLWREPGLLLQRSREGRSFRIRYLRKRAFELGEMYLGKTVVAFLVNEENADLFDNAVATISGFRFADEAMRRESGRFLPSVLKTFVAEDGRRALVLKKQPDQLLLRDVLSVTKGVLDARHVGWVLNALFNLACYLDWAELTHNAIAPETVFVSPGRHEIALLGGWWYAGRAGAPLKAMPARSVEHAPRDVLHSKRGDPRTDLELIRVMGRELLSEARGAGLAMTPDVPGPMRRWLQLPTSGDALADYVGWKDALKQSFGRPKFIPLDVTEGHVYPV